MQYQNTKYITLQNKRDDPRRGFERGTLSLAAACPGAWLSLPRGQICLNKRQNTLKMEKNDTT